jgi:multiple sugar transport system permease protein
MLLPTSSIVIVWRLLFGNMNTVMPIYILFIWKNIGFGIILFMASFTNISKEFYEAATLDGAGFITLHKKITVPLIAPTIIFVTLLEIVNSFKIFKESYLYYGTNYPPDHSYTLQFYMNNHFLKLNYQNLAACAVFTSVFVIIIITIMMKLQKRVEL